MEKQSLCNLEVLENDSNVGTLDENLNTMGKIRQSNENFFLFETINAAESFYCKHNFPEKLFAIFKETLTVDINS